MAELRAVLWDFDGTLVDSHGYWTSTWAEMAARRKGSWNEDHTLALVGMDLLDAGTYIRAHLDVQESPRSLVQEMVAGVATRMRTRVPWCAGSRELLAAIREEGIPCALVTMSYRPLVEPVLEQLLPETFAAVVTGDEVSYGKPHPDPYLQASAALGLEPEACVAIEDSATGVASARAAGCRVVIVSNHGPMTPRAQDLAVNSLVGLTVAEMRSLAAS